ncbi:MAG: hypothetical protein FWD71_21095 [Oscillospiraceae bacterium]|nr:hypothetical protein [Oscillospiraceae bacterium]
MDNIIASDFSRLLNGRRSSRFHAATADIKDSESKRLGDELLFTQANARVSLGQNPKGELRFISLPTVNYPIPVCNTDRTNQLQFYPGQYYQTDIVLYAGNLRYSLETDGYNGKIPDISKLENESFYIDDFLPVTKYQSGGLAVTITSFAPVAPSAESAALAPAPLPGPAGAFFVMHVKNNGNTPFRGRAILTAGDTVIDHYLYDDKPFPEGMPAPSRFIRQQTRILSSPVGCVGIHMHEGIWEEMECRREISLAPGEETLIETRVVLSVDYHDLMPELYGMYMLNVNQWIDRTKSFWHERLGALTVGMSGDSEDITVSRDIYIRCLIDNFNCLQVDKSGNLISHWQGMPCHISGVVWGIDIEPTAISVMQFCPELAVRVLLYFLNRSRAPVKTIPDHSTPILIAPIILAGRYLEQTGDKEFFKKHDYILPALKIIIDELMGFRHTTEYLFSSRWSSDGIVFRKYDHGTNVKVWYAFDRYAYLLKYLDAGDPLPWIECRDKLKESLMRCMKGDGPFGEQFTGGTNLGEPDEGVYIPEPLFYYDGEDTSSMLAPVYGIYGVDELLWINYHRYARSLFLTNFDPEYRTNRWFHFGAALDGTAYVSKLAGCVEPADMEQALHDIYEFDCDATGSIFWWPFGKNDCRRNSRCSQGQGALAWVYLQQWLGIHIDAVNKTLTVEPCGLPVNFVWEDANISGAKFNFKWNETPDLSTLRVTNHNAEEWTVTASFRSYASGARQEMLEQTSVVKSGNTVSFSGANNNKFEHCENIRTVENRIWGDNGIVFGPFGLCQVTYLEHGCNAVLMRFVLDNNGNVPLENIEISLDANFECKVSVKPFETWSPSFLSEAGNVHLLDALECGERYVAGFWLTLPDKLYENEIYWEWHFFDHTVRKVLPRLYINCGCTNVLETTMLVTLKAKQGSEKIKKALNFPVTLSPKIFN